MNSNSERLHTAISSLIRTFKIVQVEDDTGKPLSPAEAEALFFIAQAEGVIARDVADWLGVVPTTVTGILDRLEQAGLVARTRSDHDRRVMKLDLTDQGRAWHDAVRRRQLDNCMAMLEGLDPVEQAHFVALMEKVANETPPR
ncbi:MULTISPECIES: MarR family transcriptional regulator [unclassified Roseitalea]|uniref:MarR family winged helix-turn-helix transcriptional regulator n=1 Tax=unclassified Roseitalea TaxID=2639107 RepID=UPI00273D6836|nr:MULTISPECIES: MarR family transcriptional regulator [unclassified Roseitalea]